VKRAFKRALSREPSQRELQSSLKFLQNQQKYYDENKQQNAHIEALADFCQTLFSLNETIYID